MCACVCFFFCRYCCCYLLYLWIWHQCLDAACCHNVYLRFKWRKRFQFCLGRSGSPKLGIPRLSRILKSNNNITSGGGGGGEATSTLATLQGAVDAQDAVGPQTPYPPPSLPTPLLEPPGGCRVSTGVRNGQQQPWRKHVTSINWHVAIVIIQRMICLHLTRSISIWFESWSNSMTDPFNDPSIDFGRRNRKNPWMLETIQWIFEPFSDDPWRASFRDSMADNFITSGRRAPITNRKQTGKQTNRRGNF